MIHNVESPAHLNCSDSKKGACSSELLAHHASVYLGQGQKNSPAETRSVTLVA